MHLGNAIREISRNAYVDWIMVLAISIVVAIGLVAGGLHLYWLISSGNFKGETETVSSPKKVFDEKLLNDVVSSFKTREETNANLKKGYSGPPDPSK